MANSQPGREISANTDSQKPFETPPDNAFRLSENRFHNRAVGGFHNSHNISFQPVLFCSMTSCVDIMLHSNGVLSRAPFGEATVVGTRR
jgi:hypothetical protein